MKMFDRVRGYWKQNNTERLTPKQRRRIVKKGYRDERLTVDAEPRTVIPCGINPKFAVGGPMVAESVSQGQAWTDIYDYAMGRDETAGELTVEAVPTNVCPRCEATADDPCVTPSGNKAKAPHKGRGE